MLFFHLLPGTYFNIVKFFLNKAEKKKKVIHVFCKSCICSDEGGGGGVQLYIDPNLVIETTWELSPVPWSS